MSTRAAFSIALGRARPGHRRSSWLVLGAAAAAVAWTAGVASAAGDQKARRTAAPPPVGESMSERRAVRGSPVDDGAESSELGELRRFEEQAFPRGDRLGIDHPDGDAPTEPPPALPGKWEGTGDVPEPLRAPETTLSGAPPAAAPDSDWLRSLKTPELPVRWDPQVLRYLDYFKNDPHGRLIMGNWIRRAGRYRGLIEAVLEREGLPKDLLYLAMVESGFEASARSIVGAGGVWQFMPGAARAYGLEVGYWVDARRDPERSVEAAARYLKDLYVRFGSWHLVFAAYNAGYGAILKSITRYNTNDYWELCRHEAGLPWESSLYVPKILAAAIVGHNLEAFGYADIVPDPPVAYEMVQVPPGTGLATVARATRTKPEVISALNPQIVRDRTPPDRVTYALRIPVGTTLLFAEAFERSRGNDARLEPVTLRFGETLEDVARAHGTSVRELRRLNSVRDTSELRAGLAILAPPAPVRGPSRGGAEPAASADHDGSARGGAGAGTPDDDEILVAVPDRVFNLEGRDRVFYQTRDGDTLEDLAEVFGISPDDLLEWNNLDPTAKLHPKMVLQIFVRKDFDPTQVMLLDPAHVRVVTLGSDEFLDLEAARRGKKRLVIEARAGDTLIRLGRRYGLTTGDLARINRFSYNTELHDGQRVVVYSPVGAPPREVARGLSREPRHDRGVSALARGGTPKSGDKSADKRDAKSLARGSSEKTPTRAGAHASAEKNATKPGSREKTGSTENGRAIALRAGEASTRPPTARLPAHAATAKPGAKKK